MGDCFTVFRKRNKISADSKRKQYTEPEFDISGASIQNNSRRQNKKYGDRNSGNSEKGADPKLVSAVLVQKNWNGTGKDVTLDFGTFEIDSVDMSGPPDKVTLKSTSIPYTSKLRIEKKSRAWEKYTLKGIGRQIANESGLKLMYEASDNPQYKRKEQIQTSDIKFLQELCHAAGMALKVTTMKIVIYDAAEYDGKPAIKTFKKGSSDIISYKMGTSLTDTAYTSCHVSYGPGQQRNDRIYLYAGQQHGNRADIGSKRKSEKHRGSKETGKKTAAGKEHTGIYGKSKSGW